jgi:hypothetical protein
MKSRDGEPDKYLEWGGEPAEGGRPTWIRRSSGSEDVVGWEELGSAGRHEPEEGSGARRRRKSGSGGS